MHKDENEAQNVTDYMKQKVQKRSTLWPFHVVTLHMTERIFTKMYLY